MLFTCSDENCKKFLFYEKAKFKNASTDMSAMYVYNVSIRL